MPGTLLLDCAGLSKLYLKDRKVIGLVQAATDEAIRVATTAMTTIEADFEGVHAARVNWVLGRIDVYEVTMPVARDAAALLRTHHLHGHEDAIDAVLAAVARSSAVPATVLTSDPEDLSLLCGPAIEIAKV
jgi:hypothetical protein